MTASSRCTFILSTPPGFLNSAKTKIRQSFALSFTLFLTLSTFAQQSAPPTLPPDTPDDSRVAIGNKTTVSVLAGTRIALILTQPVQTRYLRRGDDIYAQITSPVVSGSEVVIPPGTFVQAKLDKIERHGDRGELRLQSMAITFADGYVAPVPGPITMQSDEGYMLKDPGKGRIVGAIALPLAGAGIGSLIGHSFGHSASLTSVNCSLYPRCPDTQVTAVPDTKLRDTAIGSIVGLAAGGLGSLFLVFNSHNYYLDAGSPVQMVLQQPFTVDVDQIAGTVQQSELHPIWEQRIVQPPPTPEP
jgi:hypothetical protein